MRTADGTGDPYVDSADLAAFARMTDTDDFDGQYAAGLRAFLLAQDADSLPAGHDLGRRASRERIGMLEIIENHFRLLNQIVPGAALNESAALQFLLQTLAARDFASRGAVDGTRRYEEQRARADVLAERDEFRRALVNSLQDGFFVADNSGDVVEVNDAFAEITGYGAAGLPYRWPHPWMVDHQTATQRQSKLLTDSHIQYETPIRARDGHLAWVAVSINAVTGLSASQRVFVGTLRDVTAERAFAARESAVLRLATAVGVARSVAEVLSITLDECRLAIDAQRVVAVSWPAHGGEPTIQAAGTPAASSWQHLTPFVRNSIRDARHQLPLTVSPIEGPDTPGKSCGIVALLSGEGDIALWLELCAPRWISAEDRLLVTMLVGHLSLAIRHVRQFESARETAMTLQRAMLPSMQPPPGFAVRYEPAVPPLQIGGDWYDVLPVGEHLLGIIVGDCVGRGLPAAAVMGQLRSSARALLLTGAEPARLLEQLDTAAAFIPDAFCTTVFLSLVDAESGVMRYSSAGHPPAVLTEPRCAPTLLNEAQSVPLAVRRDRPRPQASVTLTPGSTLLLYTDGLVERRSASIDEGIARVGAVVTESMQLPVDSVADAVLKELAPSSGYDDDVAMVVYRRPPAPLVIETDATADRLHDIRQTVTGWLQAIGFIQERVADVVLAVDEACANSIEHAYRDAEPGPLCVSAEIRTGALRVRIVDRGRWKVPSAVPTIRGRGLPLIKAVSTEAEVAGTDSGTTVDLSFSLPGATAGSTSTRDFSGCG
jgi:PAS domain S-box-containing protein